MIIFGRRKKVPAGGVGPFMSCMAEVKRLRQVNSIQAKAWLETVGKLRDAEAYISVLEQENQILEGEVHRLEAE